MTQQARMTVTELIQQSGDSLLQSWHYRGDQLTLTLELSEVDASVSIAIRSRWLAIDVPGPSASNVQRTCYIELAELDQLLTKQNGFYVPAKAFGSFMQEKRKNLNLAYGLKATEYAYIFSLVNSSRLISCIVADLTQITILA